MLKSFTISICLAIFTTSCFQGPNQQAKTVDSSPIENLDQQAEDNFSAYLAQNPKLAKTLTTRDWEKLRWLSKTMIVLRGGAGLKGSEDVTPYLSLSRAEIVDLLQKDQRFVETLVKFNYFFLGKNIEDIFNNTEITGLNQMSSALLSAMEVAKNGDYFELLKPSSKIVAGASEPFFFDPNDLQGGFATGAQAF
ncbi:MAG: hypothetical protein AAF202_14050, partial [Pseudomonadota bacterium]